jgi:hypothetical protein
MRCPNGANSESFIFSLLLIADKDLSVSDIDEILFKIFIRRDC